MEIVHEQAFSLDFWHLYISLSQNPEEQRQNWNTFIWIFQTLQWGYFQKLRKGHGDSFFPASSSMKIFHYPNSLLKKICYLQMCFICRTSMQKLFGWVSGPETIVLNTVAIQVQFKDPLAVFKRSKD